MASASYAAEKASGGMPQLDFSTYPAQIFWLCVALFLLYWVLTRSILPKIATGLEERHNAIADDLEQASEYKRKAETAEESYHEALKSARSKAQGIIDKTKDDIQQKMNVAIEEADAKISAQTAESEARIAEIRASSAENIETVAKDVAEALMEKLMPGGVDRASIASSIQRHLN